MRSWTAILRALPAPLQDGHRHVLMGDFNATLDHRELRRVLDLGYTDAADATGEGLVPTFPVGALPSLITIDHVLIPRGVLVRRLSVYKVARSDHRAVVAELVLSMPDVRLHRAALPGAVVVPLLALAGCGSGSKRSPAQPRTTAAVAYPRAVPAGSIVLFDIDTKRLVTFDPARKAVTATGNVPQTFQYPFPDARTS